MSSSLDILSDIAPEFSGDPDKRNRFLGYAALVVDLTLFGDVAGLAGAYLAAHMLSMAQRGVEGLRGSGRVTSQTKLRDGTGTVGFAPQLLNKLTSDEALRATVCGQEYLSLRDQLPVHGPRTLR